MQSAAAFRISAWTSIVTILVLFLASLIYCFRKAQPLYIKSFPLYCGLNLISEILHAAYPKESTEIYLGFSLFEFLYFFFVFLLVLYSVKARMVLAVVTVILWVAAILYFFRTKSVANIAGRLCFIIVLEECVVFILGSGEYVRERLVRRPTRKLTSEPAFWTVLGILVYFALVLMTFSFEAFALNPKNGPLSATLYSANNFVQVFSAASWITAMVCTKTNP